MKLDQSIVIATELRSKGLTLQQIGDKLGTSRQRVHQILSEAKRKEDLASQWHSGLSVRNRTLVEKLKINSKGELIEHIRSHKIIPYKWKNFGVRSYHDLCAWAGTDPVPHGSRSCHHCGKEI